MTLDDRSIRCMLIIIGNNNPLFLMALINFWKYCLLMLHENDKWKFCWDTVTSHLLVGNQNKQIKLEFLKCFYCKIYICEHVYDLNLNRLWTICIIFSHFHWCFCFDCKFGQVAQISANLHKTKSTHEFVKKFFGKKKIIQGGPLSRFMLQLTSFFSLQ